MSNYNKNHERELEIVVNRPLQLFTHLKYFLNTVDFE